MSEAPAILAPPDPRDQLATRSGVPEFVDKVWFQRTAAAVIDADRCVSCAACVAACPSDSIQLDDDGEPSLTRMCTGCSSCWDFCPLGGLRTERLARLLHPDDTDEDETGPVLAAYYARRRTPVAGAQDGGVVTALLENLLAQQAIDGAIVSRPRNAFDGESVLATDAASLREAAGSVYDQTSPLALLRGELPTGVERLALVGTPCQVSTLRALQRYPWPERSPAVDKVQLVVGLFCTRSFEPRRLRELLRRAGIDPRRVERIDIRDRKLVAGVDGKAVDAGPVAAFATAGLRGCDECTDFGAQLADISVGNCASPDGYTTVLVRTDAGARAWAAAADALEVHPLLDLEPIRALERRNRRRALRHLRRDFDPDGNLWIGYGEHLRAYQDSDRAPVEPPPHRSQHYQLSC